MVPSSPEEKERAEQKPSDEVISSTFPSLDLDYCRYSFR